MPRFLDITGERYGRLTVLVISPHRTSEGKARWVCLCDCGAETTVDARNLRSGSSKSCGCHRSERMEDLNARHLLSRTPEHDAWRHMRYRCFNPNAENFSDYGGRGITVCQQWESFERFYADMGPRPSPRHSLDRIDNDGDYTPDNCRWATPQQQNRNKRNNTRLSHHGRTLTLSGWSKELSISVNTLSERLSKGWSASQTLTTPVDSQQSKNARKRPKTSSP